PCGYILLLIAICLLPAAGATRADTKPDSKKAADKAAADKKIADKIKEVAGSAEFLRSLPKYFARFGGADPVNHRVTLLIEGESLVKVWPLTPDAEIKCAGWWGRLEQLAVGDRVWVWFKNDRSKHAVAVAMLADELSEQDIHGPGVTLTARDAGSVTLKPVAGKKTRTLKAAKAEV